MTKLRLILIMVAVGLLSGCATVGRFSAVDLDLRTPEQIMAYEEEAKIVYAPANAQNGANAGAINIPFDWNILKVIKGRLRIFSLEWDDSKANK